MRQAWRPPRGGWKIAKLPPRFENKNLRFAWENRKARKNSDHNSATEEMTTFLAKNGHPTTKAIKKEVRDHADDLWRAKEPHRFSPKVENSDVPPRMIAVKAMGWASSYWTLGNLMVAGEQLEDPAAAVQRFVLVGLDLLRGDTGCEHCQAHWSRLIAKFPPGELIKDWTDARVWLWRAHNISRETKAPIPYSDIARAWNWPKLTAIEINGILAGMGMVQP